MLAPLLIAALVSSHPGRCLDSYLAIGMRQQRPVQAKRGKRSPASRGDSVVRIDRVIAPPGETIGFLYLTADGGRFFGTRRPSNAPAAGKRYVREIFLRNGLVTRSRIEHILATQDGNAIIYVPNEVRLFRTLGLARRSCAPSGAAV